MNLPQIFRTGFILLTIPVLFGCSPSPEVVGKNLAQKKYECKQRQAAYYVAGLKGMLNDLKEGKFKTRRELNNKSDAYEDASAVQNFKLCEQELDALIDEVKLKFPRPDDRQTIQNAFDSYYKVLEKDIWLERDNLQKEFYAERDKLPYR